MDEINIAASEEREDGSKTNQSNDGEKENPLCSDTEFFIRKKKQKHDMTCQKWQKTISH